MSQKDKHREIAHIMGQMVKEARQQADLQQYELAERVGMTKENLSRIERGLTIPRMPAFMDMLNACGMRLFLAPYPEGLNSIDKFNYLAPLILGSTPPRPGAGSEN